MSQGEFIRRERTLMRDLRRLATERTEQHEQLEGDHERSGASAQQAYDEGLEAIAQRRDKEASAEQQSYRHTVESIRSSSRADYESTKGAYDSEKQSILERASENEREARKQWDEAVWLTETVFEANEQQPTEQYDQTVKLVDEQREKLRSIDNQARVLLRRYRQRRPIVGDVSASPSAQRDESSLQRVERCVDLAQSKLDALGGLGSARMFLGARLPILGALLIAGPAAAAAWLSEWQLNQTVLIAAGGGLVVTALIVIVLFVLAKRHTERIYRSLHLAVQEGLDACDHCIEAAEDERDRLERELAEQRDRDVRKAKEKYEPIIRQIEQRRDHHLKRIEDKYPALLEDIIARRDEELAAARERHDQRTDEIERRHDEEQARLEERYQQQMTQREEQHDLGWSDLLRRWNEGMATCAESIERIASESRELFPPWDDSAWSDWSPPVEFAPSVRVGEIEVDRGAIPGGVPSDERFQSDAPVRFILPVTLDFPDRCSLLLLTDGEGRDQSVRVLQNAMLRLLTSTPPGKVRFTIIDPVGLGQSFAGFMHLADYQESFVNSRIWTEPRHIEQRLADLTEHMENVIQKYLRNEFATIADYNEYAGEIAEPYRFLVIADFPTNFSDTAAQRLTSIVTSGARCGVHTLMSVDRRLSLPKGFDVADVEARSTTLVHTDGRWRWKDEDFADLPLTLDEPPSEDFLTDKLRKIGEASTDATRVEVPFDVIAPADDQLWTGAADRTIAVPLGRAGATKLQKLTVGSGTAQHALIAGKTGSGKSTLLHVLITNLALWYNPDEVQFYLVDFKKGVEFKTYAHHDLPHARAVAVETDREFGLSVLQRIDAELRYRGDRFRELGVQDVPGFRALGLDEPMPRTLLIVDEFQELFVEDDKLGQDAALLLDRLVRQGRAFGIHVILGSQTLGGAYTLARSTMGQMQVRIALQCSEADSYMIMSDDNAAARLLSRPGEAIYNDAGGRVEGNSPFQICWLPEVERDRSLQRIEQAAGQAGYQRSEPLIVFEGNVAADIQNNHLLESAVRELGWPNHVATRRAWLGEPIAIKGPTEAKLRRQSGANLLIVGQRDEAALAMMSAALISLATQCAPEDGRARFHLLDGSSADAPNAEFLANVCDALPHSICNVPYRDVDAAIGEIATELQRRQDDDDTDAAPIFLLIHGLQRFRSLRSTDDFSFSMDEDKPPAPDKQFADILRDGPTVGIHTITWCDTATNLNRTLDRGGLREFEMRVLFQMGGADSTQLIDSPAASKLGLKRALFFSEDEGVLEKFRPYALPTATWLEDISRQLAAKSAMTTDG